MVPISIQLPSLCLLFDVWEKKKKIVVLVGTRGYRCRPVGPAQTRTLSTAKKILCSAAAGTAIMLWLAGSPRVPTSPIPVCFICMVWLLLILFSPFVPSHLPVLIGGCLWTIIPTIMVVELAPFAWVFWVVFVLESKHEKAFVKRRHCSN